MCAAMCACWLGRRWWRDRKRQMMDEGPQGPTDWEIDMMDIKCAMLVSGTILHSLDTCTLCALAKSCGLWLDGHEALKFLQRDLDAWHLVRWQGGEALGWH